MKVLPNLSDIFNDKLLRFYLGYGSDKYFLAVNPRDKLCFFQFFYICFFCFVQVSKNPSSIRVTPSNRNSTTNSLSIQPPSETQLLRLLNSAAQKREVKATQNLSIIVAFFMICWIPLYTINCINAFCKQCFINESVIFFGIILSHLNSAINPLLYAYHLKVNNVKKFTHENISLSMFFYQDFRGALVRLFTCTSEKNTLSRPSVISQQQQRITSQANQRLAYQRRTYVDSPVWRRQQQSKSLDTITESKKTYEIDSGFGKCETDGSTPANSDPGDQSSQQFNKIFIVSDHHPNKIENPLELQRSSLYRIVSRTEEGN